MRPYQLFKYTFLNMSKTLYDITQNMKTNFGICLNSQFLNDY